MSEDLDGVALKIALDIIHNLNWDENSKCICYGQFIIRNNKRTGSPTCYYRDNEALGLSAQKIAKTIKKHLRGFATSTVGNITT